MIEITKEEFGLDLYGVIAYCSGVQQLLRMIAVGVSKGQDVAHLSERYGLEKRRAQEMMKSESISGQDAAPGSRYCQPHKDKITAFLKQQQVTG